MNQTQNPYAHSRPRLREFSMSVKALKGYAITVTLLAAWVVVANHERKQEVNYYWTPSESREVHQLVLNQLRALK